jgi:hypothetical protein
VLEGMHTRSGEDFEVEEVPNRFSINGYQVQGSLRGCLSKKKKKRNMVSAIFNEN